MHLHFFQGKGMTNYSFSTDKLFLQIGPLLSVTFWQKIFPGCTGSRKDETHDAWLSEFTCVNGLLCQTT